MDKIRGFFGAIWGSSSSKEDSEKTLTNPIKDEHDKPDESEIKEARNTSHIGVASKITKTSQDSGYRSSLPRIQATSKKHLVSGQENEKCGNSSKDDRERGYAGVACGSLVKNDEAEDKVKTESVPRRALSNNASSTKDKSQETSVLPVSSSRVRLPRIGREDDPIGRGLVCAANERKITEEANNQQPRKESKTNETLLFPAVGGNSSDIFVRENSRTLRSKAENAGNSPKKEKKRKKKKRKRDKPKPVAKLPDIHSPASAQFPVNLKESPTVGETSNMCEQLKEDDLPSARNLNIGDQELNDFSNEKKSKHNKLPQIKRWLHKKSNVVTPLLEPESNLVATVCPTRDGAVMPRSGHLARLVDKAPPLVTPARHTGHAREAVEALNRSLGTAPAHQAQSLRTPPSTTTTTRKSDLKRIPPSKSTQCDHHVRLVNEAPHLMTPASLTGESARAQNPPLVTPARHTGHAREAVEALNRSLGTAPAHQAQSLRTPPSTTTTTRKSDLKRIPPSKSTQCDHHVRLVNEAPHLMTPASFTGESARAQNPSLMSLSCHKVPPVEDAHYLVSPASHAVECTKVLNPPLQTTTSYKGSIRDKAPSLVAPKSLTGKCAREPSPSLQEVSSQARCSEKAKAPLPEPRRVTLGALGPGLEITAQGLPCGVEFVPAPVPKLGTRRSETTGTTATRDQKTKKSPTGKDMRGKHVLEPVPNPPQIPKSMVSMAVSNRVTLTPLEDPVTGNLIRPKKKKHIRSAAKSSRAQADIERPLTAKLPPYPEHWGQIPTQRPPGRGGHGFFLGIFREPTKGDPLFSSSSSEGKYSVIGHEARNKQNK